MIFISVFKKRINYKLLKFFTLNFIFFLSFQYSFSQEVKKTDESEVLEEVVVQIYPESIKLKNVTGSISLLNKQYLRQFHDYSLIPAFNSVAGVRMEERSPGSYRLSIRGSLIRSPFGVRNVKVYFEGIPLTDASGNTYLNSLDQEAIQGAEIIKGPDGSLFGANTGGVVHLLAHSRVFTDTTLVRASLSGGSFGLLRQSIAVSKYTKKFDASFTQSFQKSSGFRDHSALQRNYFQGILKWKPTSRYNLQFTGLYSRLYYQTPGGLTSVQMQQNYKAARPSTAFIPGSEEQNAGIRNDLFFSGLTQEIKISDKIKHHLILFGSIADFENPFITNYETRIEKSLGLRTYAVIEEKINNAFSISGTLGLETQNTTSNIKNYGNFRGNKDTLQYDDKIDAIQTSLFSNVKINLLERLILDGGISINQLKYVYNSYYPVASAKYENKFNTVWMPKIGALFYFIPEFAIRGSVSKGFSPPTLSEFRPSNNQFYPNLQPETGINYEAGFRYINRNGIWNTDIVLFHYQLQNTIVRRNNEAGQEYFLNSGNTIQKGIEWQTKLNLINNSTNFINHLSFFGSLTYYDFRFNNYKVGEDDFSNKKLTGVPDITYSVGVHLSTKNAVSLSINYLYTDRIPLNDANSVIAPSYHLLQSKIGYTLSLNSDLLTLFVGGDNLLNQKYSLGNDLNAFGGRYFNAAPSINFYLGATFQF